MTVINYKNIELNLKGGLFIHGEKNYSACTAVESSNRFKTLKGAIAWLAKRGYKES